MRWKLEDSEATIERIVEEMKQGPERGGKQKIFDDLRAQLEREPTLLQPFQIDVIVREVRRRLKGDDK